ncbi:MAG: transketolase C-terminal domain-containing protein [Lachnospiraceae bacterium]|uniref:transketolase C-terminal domain-containing protein n=1 Tax=Sarcina sp. DSM 11001 TaxID=1798184 RepID=UPI000B84D25B|nr:transketolase C-terminal domain-containing protein [Sarcina sp. DSM 11001]MDO5485749.1 transketolase C-terminal domain-containing protein [Sarcina sp.]MEE1040445.1 transketolase C-terminal domain-containing protein [Lachnospiraceae bacterium]
MSGNEAVAYGIRQVNPDVMPAFPITPSTEIPQMVSTYIANGEIDTEFIPVESEHSAMSAAIGAEAAGARTMTATSSAGLALMWEELLLAASNRLPLVLTLVNRTLSGPININCDHSDGMGARDTGWIQIYAENNQEAYDNYLQAFPIAEDPRVHLPVMVCQDGFITSHAVENIELLEDGPVREFVGTYTPEEYLLNPGKPVAVGPYSVSSYAMEAKKAQEDAMEHAGAVILEVADRFEKLSGRRYGFFEEYRTQDADYIMLIMGSAAGTAKAAVDELREQGWKAGVLKLRVFRPFPEKEIAEALRGCRAVAIMDRCESYNGCSGPLGSEVPAALYRSKVMTETVNYIYGLAGRDFTVDHVKEIFAELRDVADGKQKAPQHKYINLRSK